MSLVNVKAVEEAVAKELAEEATAKAKNALKAKMRELAQARQVVQNIERQLEDLRAAIGSGEF